MGPRPGRTRTAVDRVGRGKERQVNARFLAMASHYVFEPAFCSPAAGWEKGQVEKNVQDSRHRLWQPMPDFPDIAALNDWLEQRCQELWHEIPHGALPGSVADVWAEERATLMQLPPAFDGFVEHSKRVSPTCLISFERNRYSVPASFANRPVSLRVYPDRLVVVLKARLWRDAAEGNILCEHGRVIQRSHNLPPQTIHDWRHYLAPRHCPRTMYGWLLLGKGSVNFWRLVGCGHVFGVIGAAWLPRAMMNSAWIWSQSMARAVKGRFGSNGVSASFCRQFAITSLCTLPFWSARVVDVDGPYCCSCVSRA